MTDIEKVLSYFIDKAFDYRNPISHKHLACVYHFKQMISYKGTSYYNNDKELFLSYQKDLGNEIPFSFEKMVSIIEDNPA